MIPLAKEKFTVVGNNGNRVNILNDHDDTSPTRSETVERPSLSGKEPISDNSDKTFSESLPPLNTILTLMTMSRNQSSPLQSPMEPSRHQQRSNQNNMVSRYQSNAISHSLRYSDTNSASTSNYRHNAKHHPYAHPSASGPSTHSRMNLSRNNNGGGFPTPNSSPFQLINHSRSTYHNNNSPSHSHALQVDENVRIPCEVEECTKTFSSKAHLARHMKIHRGVKDYRCSVPGCTREFTRHDNMVQHFKRHAARYSRETGVPIEHILKS
eukprot:Partr_v1_DN24981_c1_g1_i1_m45146